MQTRRDFLKSLTVAAAALSLNPFKGIETNADLYYNARLGLHARLPAAWEFASVADFVALREHQVFLDLIEVGGETHPLKDPENPPVFLFEDPKYRKGHFAPAITLYDEPLDHVPPTDERVAHLNMLDAISTSHRDLGITSNPENLEMDGEVGTISKWTYLHEIDSGEEIPLRVISIIVFRSERVHTFYLVDDRENPCINDDIWSGFIKSIKYDSK